MSETQRELELFLRKIEALVVERAQLREALRALLEVVDAGCARGDYWHEYWHERKAARAALKREELGE